MKSDRAGIFIDLKQLQRLLKLSLFAMTKADRIIYGTPALQAVKSVLAHFVMAYDFADERDYYIRLFVAEFTNLRLDIEDIFEAGCIKATNPEAIGGRHINPDSLKKEMVDLIARADEGVSKWYNSNDHTMNKAAWRVKMLDTLVNIYEGIKRKDIEA